MASVWEGGKLGLLVGSMLSGLVLVTCLPIAFLPFLFLLRAGGGVVVSGGEGGKQIEALRVSETNLLV